MRPLHRGVKFIVVVSVLVPAFAVTTMLSIVVSVNLSAPVQNSRKLYVRVNR